jgi:hypothetical protein
MVWGSIYKHAKMVLPPPQLPHPLFYLIGMEAKDLLGHPDSLEGICECVGSVTTLLLAETKESERMDTSSKQQRTYEESKRESGKRNGKSKEVKTETGKV